MLPRLCLSPSLISPEAVGSSVHTGILSVFPFPALESSSKSGGPIKPWRTGSTTGPAFKQWRTENVAKFSRVLSCGCQILEGSQQALRFRELSPHCPVAVTSITAFMLIFLPRFTFPILLFVPVRKHSRTVSFNHRDYTIGICIRVL